MAISIKHEEYTHKGRRVVLDTARLAPTKYETMLLRASDYRDIACMTATTEAEAIEQFGKIKAEHPADKKPAAIFPLTGKYAKLRDDLMIALEAGRAAESANPEDGGTCNFDSAAISLPRWPAEKVQQAAREAGTSVSSCTVYGTRWQVSSPSTRSQGNARSRNAKAMTAALRSMGYEATCYYQMD